jgi:two-component system, OmpR family, copper resistance phosphate regulon response regulator CusR
MMRVLIVEDETKLAAAISDGLHENEYKTIIVNSGEAGMKCILESTFDVILLDLMLPGSSGLEILRTVRRNGLRTPVLILTSKGTLDDRVRGFDLGADDYLVKPFAFPELLARIRALHRRANPETPSTLQLADLRMEISGHLAVRGNTPLELTAREFELLEYLLANRGTVVSREMIARDVWHSPVRYTTLDNVIDVHIARIRRKLDDPFPVKLLHTVRGVGFVLRNSEEN